MDSWTPGPAGHLGKKSAWFASIPGVEDGKAQGRSGRRWTNFLRPLSKSGFVSVNAGAPKSHGYTLFVCPLLFAFHCPHPYPSPDTGKVST